jgi:uncharacterized protein
MPMVRRLLVVCALAMLAVQASAATRYVTDAAGAPVKWEEWGPRAIGRAVKEKRPMFVSIGFASSFECFRMHREAFLNGENAELLNAYFVPVLLDRLAWPEIAESYETIARSMNGASGWPLNVVVTPALEPFAAAGYMTPADLNRMLVLESNRWAGERDAAIASAQSNVQKARELGERRAPGVVDPNVIEDITVRVSESWLPMPLSLLARRNVSLGESLRKIAAWPLRDQLGGGFHRARRDADQPYFEKMLADQALYGIAYLEAWQQSRDPQLERVARGIFDATIRDLQRASGGPFDASQDAHNLVPAQGPEFWNGAFYVWTAEEVEHLLGPELAPLVMRLYGMKPGVRNVPALEEPALLPDEKVAAGVARLLDVRQKRPQPFRESAPMSGLNGLMISALARAGAVFGERAYIQSATSAATYVTTKLWSAPKKTLLRTDGIPALGEDYAFLVQGLLDLFEATHEVRWLDLAVELQKKQDALFWDESLGRYTTGSTVPQALRGLLVERDFETPAVNSAAAMNLLRLSLLVPNDAWRARPQIIFTSFGTRLRNDGAQLPQLASAYAASLAEGKVIVVVGDPRLEATHAMLREIQSRFEPLRAVVLVPAKGTARERVVQSLPFTAALAPSSDPKQPLAYVCRGGQCGRQ